MAKRRGRPRKQGERTASGRLKERPYQDRVKPTRELARKKAAVGGREVEDPLSYLSFDPGAIEALSRFRSALWSAGYRPKGLTANFDPTPMGLGDELLEEERELTAKGRKESGLGAALMVSVAAHEALLSFSSHWGGEWKGDLCALYDAALAVAEEWHIHIEDNRNILRSA